MRAAATPIACALFIATMAGCSKPDLAHRVDARIRAAVPEAKVEIIDATTLRVKQGDLDSRLSLDNLNTICKQGEAACDQAIEHLVANVAALRAPGKPAPENVRAILKPPEFVERARSAIAASPPEKRADNELFLRPFGGGVVSLLVIDMPDGIQMLNHGDAKLLGLDDAKLWTLAHQNLAKALAPVPATAAAPGVLRVQAGDDYEAARLLVPEIWDDVARQVKGDLVVVAPNRQVVYATGDGDEAGKTRMKELAAKAFAEAGYPLSTAVFRRTPAGFVPVE